MIRLCFAGNPLQAETLTIRDRLISLAKSKGFDCVCAQDDLAAQADFMVVVGGDGSLIRQTGFCQKHGIPLLGVHAGRVGFLSETCEDEFSSCLDKLQSNQYLLESRGMIACSINGRLLHHCINDVMVFKNSFSGVAQIELCIDEQSVGSFFGDGVVVATPTGSTGYSLSAGGPIVAGDMDAIIITPICPHTLHIRPIVASVNSLIKLSVVGKGRVAADGEQISVIRTGDCVELCRSDKTVDFVRFNKLKLFERIQQKLI